MILAPHAIIGTAFARVVTSNPIGAFFVGFLSHFIADMIPHWEYKISNSIHPEISEKISLNKEFLKDILKLSLDGTLGLILSFLFFYNGDPYFIIAAALGGIFPDFLQFLYGKIKTKPLILFKRFHDLTHADKLEDKVFFGIFSQVVVVFIFVVLSYWIYPF